MFGWIHTYLEKICCFFILMEMLIQFSPAKHYERHIKVLSGLMGLAIILLPMGEYLFQRGKTDLLPASQVWADQVESIVLDGMDSEDLSVQIEAYEQRQREQMRQERMGYEEEGAKESEKDGGARESEREEAVKEMDLFTEELKEKEEVGGDKNTGWGVSKISVDKIIWKE